MYCICYWIFWILKKMVKYIYNSKEQSKGKTNIVFEIYIMGEYPVHITCLICSQKIWLPLSNISIFHLLSHDVWGQNSEFSIPCIWCWPTNVHLIASDFKVGVRYLQCVFCVCCKSVFKHSPFILTHSPVGVVKSTIY